MQAVEYVGSSILFDKNKEKYQEGGAQSKAQISEVYIVIVSKGNPMERVQDVLTYFIWDFFKTLNKK